MLQPTSRALALVVAGLLACTASSDPSDPPLTDTDSCPTPANGVQVGGEAMLRDQAATPTRAVVLMGGGPEDDGAAGRFVDAAETGDVVVLRASGSLTSYPSYFRSLAATPGPATIQTVLTSQPQRGDQDAVLCRIGRAEALWLAGGNQWNYLGLWPTALHDALQSAHARNAVVGGTSAGAMAWGEASFSARLGSVNSSEALADPLAPDAELAYPPFYAPELAGTLVDTHFSDRDREGRLLAFLARYLHEREAAEAIGIGLDEGVAIVIEGERWTVEGPNGQYAWLYRVRDRPEVSRNKALDLSGVTRLRLNAGDSGGWPVDFDVPGTDALEVVAGEVR